MYHKKKPQNLCRRGSPKRSSIVAVGIMFIAPFIAGQVNLCSLLSNILLTSYLTINHQTVWSHVCKSSATPWVSDPSAFAGPESPVGLMNHVFQLCLLCQSPVQNESKVSDLCSQLRFVSRECQLL